MHHHYDPKQIETKWQAFWAEHKTFATPEDVSTDNKEYILPQLPYPSGSGLHVGHSEVYTACDIYARYQRMVGKKVLQVIGWDSFGLPAENYAIKTNVHPKISTDKAIDNFRQQITSLGISVDWDREVGSHNADYYKWTQWFFLLMYKQGLAYRKAQAVNWCESCKTVLANAQVVDGHCERCDTIVIQKEMEQWYLRITDYADKLLEGLDRIDWPEETKKRQQDWIGKSEGVNWKLKVKDSDVSFDAFDSVPQTHMAQTFAVIAPEHQDLPGLVKGTKYEQEVMAFVEDIKQRKMEGNKFAVQDEIEGVFTGRYIEDPYGTGDLPLWVASFALVDYGSGVVSCSAHDERDFAFAKKYDIPLRVVMVPEDDAEAEKVRHFEYCYHHDPEAVMLQPEKFHGRKWGEVREDIIDYVVEKGIGERATQYKLRDWSVSRQRFWGAPIPMIMNEGRKQKKRQYIFLHGRTATKDADFWPWLKSTLEAEGHKVWCETMPNTDTPKDREQAQFVLDNAPLSEDCVIVGHSYGGPVAYRVLEQWNKPVAKLVLIDTVIQPDFNDKERPSIVDSTDWTYDFARIAKLPEETVLVADANYTVIPKDQIDEQQQAFDARLVLINPTRYHITGVEEPGLLEEVFISGVKPLSVSDLPVELPDDVDFKPTGQSPLTYSESFQSGVEEKYGKGWKREVDTLDTFMCSSWYYYRYLDPKNDGAFASPEALKKWMPVDFYLGGAEHVNGHLLYSRFFTKVLHDAGYIDFDEPFTVHRHQGLILGEDNRKMSKRWGNVVNPTDVVNEYGADTCRVYEMFMGPLEDDKPWNTQGVKGVRRFLDRVWRLFVDDRTGELTVVDEVPNKDQEQLLHKTIKKVGADTASLQFNTAVACMMEFVNAANKWEGVPKDIAKIFVLLLSPYAPHIAEELWQKMGGEDSLALEAFPQADESKLVTDSMTIVIQVNGKVRDKIEVDADVDEDTVKNQALAREKIQKWLDGNEPKKVIYVKGKLVSIVI